MKCRQSENMKEKGMLRKMSRKTRKKINKKRVH
jgi:hypothetical protein